ncbi:hypothetical protein ABZX90_31740 [Streptomyces sp. NPDC002935]|uniref:hypothetical protein n=1 Tax=Streptomyces sp. NPDC002935 TaxID=3154545 RepID=UPI0033B5F723
MARVRRTPENTRARLVAAVCTGLLCAALTGCGNDGSATADASTASASTLASDPPTSAPASPPEPTPSVSEVPTPTDEPATTGSPDKPVPADASDASSLWGKRFSGSAKISVDIYDYCTTDGSRRQAGSQTYSMNSTLDLSRPRTGGDETESNPFSMLFAAGDPSQAGAVSFWSSAVSTTSSQDLAGNPRDPHLLLTYWDIDWSDGELDARLTDPHTQQAVALNLLNWSSPVVACRSDLGQLPGGYPHALASGTTFAGRLDGSSASLTAEGSSIDGQVAFRFEFDGTAS